MDKCFADNGRGRCLALNANCKDCGFFKTKEEFEEGREKALERLKTLNVATRRYIAEKYKIKFEVLNIPKE